MARAFDRKRDPARMARDRGASQVDRELIWACLSKVRYPDEFVARAATAVHLEVGSSEQTELWVHHCVHCRGWHTTKRPQAGAASITAGDVFHEARR